MDNSLFSSNLIEWINGKKENVEKNEDSFKFILIENESLLSFLHSKILLDEISIQLSSNAMEINASSSHSILFVCLGESLMEKKKRLTKMRDSFKKNINSNEFNFSFCDAWSNSSQWNEMKREEEIELNAKGSLVKKMEEWKERNGKEGEKSSSSLLIVLDSLSVLYQHPFNSLQSILEWNRRQEKKVNIIGMVQSDLLPSKSSLLELEYAADIVSKISLHPSHPQSISLSSAFRKPSGKSSLSNQSYSLNANGRLKNLKEVQVSSEPKEQPSSKSADPTANLTFNLKLTDEERKAKESVVLPYRYHLKENEQNSTQSKSVIYLDEDDDAFNDEDDDLDI